MIYLDLALHNSGGTPRTSDTPGASQPVPEPKSVSALISALLQASLKAGDPLSDAELPWMLSSTRVMAADGRCFTVAVFPAHPRDTVLYRCDDKLIAACGISSHGEANADEWYLCDRDRFAAYIDAANSASGHGP